MQARLYALALEKLLQALREGGDRKRREAAEWVTKLGPAAKRTIPELLTLLRDPRSSREIRAAADRALGEIGTPEKVHVPLLNL